MKNKNRRPQIFSLIVYKISFFGGKKKNKTNFLKSALSCQKAKSFLFSILSLSYLYARLSFYTCCQRPRVYAVRHWIGILL